MHTTETLMRQMVLGSLKCPCEEGCFKMQPKDLVEARPLVHKDTNELKSCVAQALHFFMMNSLENINQSYTKTAKDIRARTRRGIMTPVVDRFELWKASDKKELKRMIATHYFDILNMVLERIRLTEGR